MIILNHREHAEPYRHIGCFNDRSTRAMVEKLGKWKAGVAISKCGDESWRKGYEVFGVQYSGECWSAKNASSTYAMYGNSSKCENGTGGGWANDVYSFLACQAGYFNSNSRNVCQPCPVDTYKENNVTCNNCSNPAKTWGRRGVAISAGCTVNNPLKVSSFHINVSPHVTPGTIIFSLNASYLNESLVIPPLVYTITSITTCLKVNARDDDDETLDNFNSCSELDNLSHPFCIFRQNGSISVNKNFSCTEGDRFVIKINVSDSANVSSGIISNSNGSVKVTCYDTCKDVRRWYEKAWDVCLKSNFSIFNNGSTQLRVDSSNIYEIYYIYLIKEKGKALKGNCSVDIRVKDLTYTISSLFNFNENQTVRAFRLPRSIPITRDFFNMSLLCNNSDQTNLSIITQVIFTVLPRRYTNCTAINKACLLSVASWIKSVKDVPSCKRDPSNLQQRYGDCIDYFTSLVSFKLKTSYDDAKGISCSESCIRIAGLLGEYMTGPCRHWDWDSQFGVECAFYRTKKSQDINDYYQKLIAAIGQVNMDNLQRGTIVVRDAGSQKARRKCVGDFRRGGAWKEPNVDHCKFKSQNTKALHDLSKTKVNPANAKQIANNLTTVFKKSSSQDLTEADANLAAKILQDIVSIGEKLNETAELVLDVIDTIMEMNETTLDASKDAATKIVKVLDQVAENVPIAEGQTSKVLTTGNLVLQANKVTKASFRGIGFGVKEDGSPTTTVDRSVMSVHLPRSVLDHSNQASSRVGFIHYGNNKLFQSQLQGDEIKLSRQVLSSSVYNTTTSNLTKPVRLRISRLKGGQSLGNASCVYWNEEALLLIVFMAGVNGTNSRLGCQIAAVLLHYLTLVTVFWMGIEAYNLYLQIVKVMAIYKRKFMFKAAVVGWGVPLLIVLATLTAAIIQYKQTGGTTEFYYGNQEACILHNYLYRLVGWFSPILAILFINLIIFCVVVRKLHCTGAMVPVETKSNERKRCWTAFAILSLLGLTWLFGALAISDARIVFEYLFCIFNSLQGFFIFFFHCVRIKEVRNQWSFFVSGLGFSHKKSEHSQQRSRGVGESRNSPQAGRVRGKSWTPNDSGAPRKGTMLTTVEDKNGSVCDDLNKVNIELDNNVNNHTNHAMDEPC
ncbi:hypothetical protein QZH41_009483 [Actinostola sp. cb2023]|nr:hypothetical protein QZH41_009483 [Actinostola sp. cb2023]